MDPVFWVLGGAALAWWLASKKDAPTAPKALPPPAIISAAVTQAVKALQPTTNLADVFKDIFVTALPNESGGTPIGQQLTVIQKTNLYNDRLIAQANVLRSQATAIEATNPMLALTLRGQADALMMHLMK